MERSFREGTRTIKVAGNTKGFKRIVGEIICAVANNLDVIHWVIGAGITVLSIWFVMCCAITYLG